MWKLEPGKRGVIGSFDREGDGEEREGGAAGDVELASKFS